MSYYGTEWDHWQNYLDDNDLTEDEFTLEDYRERMWEAEQDRREVRAMDAFDGF